MPSAPFRFDELYTKYRQNFVRLAMSYVRDRMTAEDIVTDSFLAFWQEGDRDSDVRNPSAYIYASVRNRCLNVLRDRRQQMQARQEMHSATVRMREHDISSLEANEPHAAYMAEIAAIIERELRQMPARTRRVYLSHRYEDMSYREIALIYGLSQRQVEYEIRNAKDMLCAALKDYVPVALLLALLH